MVDASNLVEQDGGLVPEGDGWFVVNCRDARWHHSERFGSSVSFEGSSPFPELGIALNVLRPGQSLGMYHGENAQEDFLVRSTRSSAPAATAVSCWRSVHAASIPT